jgi:uncharacterized protein
VSQLSDRFVRDPREAVKAGQVVSVTVVEVDAARKRIALSMKSRPVIGARAADGAGGGPQGATRGAPPAGGGGRPSGAGAGAGAGGARSPAGAARREPAAETTALGAALARAIRR